MWVLSNRFTGKEIFGGVVIVHEKPNDFITQSSGNAGNKIGYGKYWNDKKTHMKLTSYGFL